MDKNKLAKLLFAIWLLFYFLFSIGSSAYTSYQQVFRENDPTVFLSVFQLFTLGIILLFFIPFLFLIYYFAKQTDLEKMKRNIRILLIILGIWSAFMIACTILAAVMPEAFSMLLDK